MLIRLFTLVIIMVSSFLLGCGDKEEIPLQETSRQPDIEKLETIETSDIPSLYDDDELLLDVEPSSEPNKTEQAAHVKEPDVPETDSEGTTEDPDMGIADSIEDIAEELSDEDISPPQPVEKPGKVIEKQDVAENQEQQDVSKKEKPAKPKKPEKQIARVTPPEKRTAYKPAFSKGGKYIVSLGSFKEKINAVNLLNKFKHNGYPVTIDIVSGQKKDNTGQMYYRVNIGSFATRTEAEKFGQNVVAKRGQTYWINVKK